METVDYVKAVVVPILEHPEDFTIVETKDDRGVLLVLKCNPSDMGMIIGRSGKTADAIRLLARIIGVKSNVHVGIKITDPRK